ncbi:MAG: aminopeptidase P N-terminal domain-containing protein [Nannocystaceae bacterium]|nr:aminopeptidase P N-terminal domain-containing protein [Nannocystaceae bacterium]
MLRLPAEVHVQRRQQLLDALPEGGALLLPTANEVVRSNTTNFPFRPNSDFYYVTGYPEPQAWALLKKSGPDAGFFLFVLPRDRTRETWTGVRHGVQGAKSEFGADEAFKVDDLDRELGRLLEDVDQLYFAFGRHGAKERRLHRILDRVRTGRKPALGPATLRDPAEILAPMRLIKSEAELAVMRRGVEITTEAHIAAMKHVRPGMPEYEIQALLEYTFRKHGAWGWAYPSIVAGGANACILHYVRNDATIGEGELMLIDAGAEVDCYATDVTRCSPANGRFTAAQRDVYEAVLGVQERAIESVRPGFSIDEMHEVVLRELTQAMIDLGALKGDVEGLVESKAFEAYYPHRTSHWLGADVHDVGRYRQRSGPPLPFEAGMVLTVEPGLYFPPDADCPKHLRGIAVRIEDDVLVTDTGHEVLTDAIPKRVDEIEALRS